MFKVNEHRLYKENDEPVEFLLSPNHGDEIDPRYIILHYTDTLSFTSPLYWLRNPASKVSAHLLVGRDGRVVQLVPFNLAAWHAGRSRWKGLVGMNSYSIGIEMVNVPNTPYTQEQVDTVANICKALLEAYDIEDIIGHEDVAPGRKFDPGKEWKMDEFKKKLGFEPILMRGSQGEDVIVLQNKLTEMNLYSGKIDGDFGPMTEKAVKKYQQMMNQEQTGKIKLSELT
jgi:N-acetylmuramoyl-L-alanine amidase